MDTAIQVDPTADQRPTIAEIDAFGITHPGRVRRTNADHFLVATLHRTLRVHATSLGGIGPQESESRGVVLLVADGVGGLAGAEEGSARAVTTVAQHLLNATELCSQMATTNESDAIANLRDAVASAHRALLTATDEDGHTKASTLTMFASFWPRAFVVHVGDSRAYRYRDGKLERLTTDQTFAQMMVESGALTPAGAEASHLKHVLWSALGSQEVVPEVHVTDVTRRGVVMLCTDGLTTYVKDDEIKSYLANCRSAEETCGQLLNLALERGGHDNVTVVIAHVRNGGA